MDVTRDGKALLWGAAARLEQEIRAYPRVYSAFYRTLNASPAVRRGVGRVKRRVRQDGRPLSAPAGAPALTLALQRREQVTAVRLGLRSGTGS